MSEQVKKKICIELNNCMSCPYVKEQRHYTSDSFEMAFDYFCGQTEDKKIAGYIEREREMPSVPDWCPLLA